MHGEEESVLGGKIWNTRRINVLSSLGGVYSIEMGSA